LRQLRPAIAVGLRSARSSPAIQRPLQAQCIDPDGSSDILNALLAHIVERVRQPIADLFAHRPRYADPAGLRERFQACSDIDAVTENVTPLEDDAPPRAIDYFYD
jgi:hypothetical protein